MRSYLAFTHSHIADLKGDAYNEGVTLAIDCLEQLAKLNNPERFPPSLLILLTSPRYSEVEDAEHLLNGIHDTFVRAHSNQREVPLIGCGVAAVFCDMEVYERGAVLICLASHLLRARMGVGVDARQNPRRAVDELLDQLELGPAVGVDPNPLANRLLLTFLPGLKVEDGQEFYPAPELHRCLRAGVQARIGLAGGVCSVGDADRARDGLLYCGRRAYRDAVVAGRIDSGVPIGVALSYGFQPTGKVLQVTEVAEDRRTVLAFDKCSPEELLKREGSDGGDARGILLVKLSTDGEPIIDLPQFNKSEGSLHLLRRTQHGDCFQVMKPDGESTLEHFKQGYNRTRERFRIESPVGCLAIFGRALNNCFRRFFDISRLPKFVRDEGITCVGGLFDGELGVDEAGRSLFVNGASSCLIFGDEMRERTAPYQGMNALAEFGPLLNNSERVIEGALKIVVKTGFPGAMLSLVLRNRDALYIVARDAEGSRFEKIVDITRRACDGSDILAVVAGEKTPKFVPDSGQDGNCNQEAVGVSGIVSQYILPLKRLDGDVFGILQVDLGDLRHRTEDEFRRTEKAKALNSLAEIFEAALNRITNHEETRISAELDQALNRSLSAASVEEGLQQFIGDAVRTFGADMAHIRLAQQEGALAGAEDEPRLRLVAGYGACYDIGKNDRREVSSKDKSLIYSAFSRDTVIIVNDVTGDSDYLALCREVAGNARLTEAVGRIKSYAAMAFKNEKGQKLWAFSLAAEKPWFFAEYLERAVQSLGQRIAFLIEHLRAKNRLEFLFKVSTRLAEIDLDEMPQVLANALKTFCEAIKAEVGSLYLWDGDLKRFILQAQHGWQNPEWVSAAYYRKKDAWIGVRALKKQPRYIDDLYQYYKNNPGGPGERHGQYAQNMFGHHLSASFTVEAISLPLKIGKKQKKFGVLTVYRRIRPGEGTGFLSTDTKLLEEGAYKMAGLVNALVEHRNDTLRHQEQARHRAIYEAISPLEVRDGFEAKTCQQVLAAYGGGEVAFYKADDPDAKIISWVAGYRRIPDIETLEESPDVQPDTLVRGAASNALSEGRPEKVAVQRHRVTPQGHHSPQAIATDGLIKRICIPLVGAQKFVGVLDMRWRIPTQRVTTLDVQPKLASMRQLGLMIGSAYQQHQSAKEAEQSRSTVQAVGAYLFQKAHRLNNAIQDLYSLAQAIREARTNEERQAKVEELVATAEEYTETIKWAMDMGERVQDPERERLLAYNEIKESFVEIDNLKDREKEIHLAVGEDLAITGAPELLRQIFVNLINNAFDAMRPMDGSKKQAILEISAACIDKKAVEIVFEDNGVGMTQRGISNAEKGFVISGSHRGSGVLISRVLAMVQGGSLRYESQVGRGTKAILTLPVG
jgi:signal transduction histidine kinase